MEYSISIPDQSAQPTPSTDSTPSPAPTRHYLNFVSSSSSARPLTSSTPLPLQQTDQCNFDPITTTITAPSLLSSPSNQSSSSTALELDKEPAQSPKLNTHRKPTCRNPISAPESSTESPPEPHHANLQTPSIHRLSFHPIIEIVREMEMGRQSLWLIPYSTSQDGLHDHDNNSDQPAQPKPSSSSIPTSFMHFYDIKPESLMHEILISSSSSTTPPPLQFILKHAHMDQSKVEVITTAAVITTTSDSQSLSSLASSSSSNLSLTPELVKEPAPPWKFIEHQNPAAIYGNSIPAHENSTPMIIMISCIMLAQPHLRIFILIGLLRFMYIVEVCEKFENYFFMGLLYHLARNWSCQMITEYVLMEDHPIFEIVEQQQLGRNVLVLAIPMAIALFSIYKFEPLNVIEIMPAMRLIALMLSVAVALIWNGILLRRIWKRVSNLVELLGIALMFGAFYMFGVLLLPGELALIPAICFMLCLIPFVKAFFSQKEPETIGSNTDAHSLPPV
ncbi:hypothetical protein GH714_039960 [Hevea brasiliensis]|uniref:Transmembrane protein n=1 Tax=Hevea brasiliensis TaxID=3981 RepID=A0A6A6MIH5_HEVBR|nr:hypothetical protein GH714_039960 [Hevea brasiliensis]